jgi:DNA-binding CsgD family transcriptional regulator
MTAPAPSQKTEEPATLSLALGTHYDKQLFRKDHGLTGAEDLGNLLRRLKPKLAQVEYQVIQAVIVLRPQGYSAQEIAESIGIDAKAFSATLASLHEKLVTMNPVIARR